MPPPFSIPRLNDTHLRLLAWFVAGGTITMMVIGLALQAITGSSLGGASVLITNSEVAGLCCFSIVGLVILVRHPNHPIGWLWLLIAFGFGSDHFAWGYAAYGYLAHPGSLPGAQAAIIWLYW